MAGVASGEDEMDGVVRIVGGAGEGEAVTGARAGGVDTLVLGVGVLFQNPHPLGVGFGGEGELLVFVRVTGIVLGGREIDGLVAFAHTLDSG